MIFVWENSYFYQNCTNMSGKPCDFAGVRISVKCKSMVCGGLGAKEVVCETNYGNFSRRFHKRLISFLPTLPNLGPQDTKHKKKKLSLTFGNRYWQSWVGSEDWTGR